MAVGINNSYFYRADRPTRLAFFLTAALGLALTACAEGHCRKPTPQSAEAKPVDQPDSSSNIKSEANRAEPTASPKAKPVKAKKGSGAKKSPATSTDSSPAPAQTEGSVFVYKYDGSVQCQGGKTINLEAMAKQLRGIPVLSSAKKHDGLAHIQACGSGTGVANVYEIPVKYLKTAEAKGFKKWSFE